MKNGLKRLTSIMLTLVMALSIFAVPGVSFASENESGEAAYVATETKISSDKVSPIAAAQSGSCGKGVT